MNLSFNPGLYSSSAALNDTHNAENHLDTHHSQENFQNILHSLLYVKETTTIQEIKEIYRSILTLLPSVTSEKFNQLIKELRPLLQYSSILPNEQLLLAFEIGNWYSKHLEEGPKLLESCIRAMRYYVKAIAIAKESSGDSTPLHEAGSQLWMRIIEKTLLNNNLLKNKLEFAAQMGDLNGFKIVLSQIDYLKQYCYQKDKTIIQSFYRQASDVIFYSNPAVRRIFEECFDVIQKGEKGEFILSTVYLTEKYSQNLESFREIFTLQKFKSMLQKKPIEIRKLQTDIFDQFKTFFDSLLKDAFAILGNPPCNYDIRAMGSISREEISPFSDLEWMILIENENYKDYFVNLARFIELQTLTLGESGEKDSRCDPLLDFFSCLRKPHLFGFYMDGNPAEDQDLIATPSTMANLQKGFLNDPATINHTVQKSISLAQNTSKLFEEYQTQMWKILDSEIENIPKRQKSSFEFLKERAKDYAKMLSEGIPNILDIKKHYVELLNHTLSDFALYFGVKKVNTLDILDDLVDKKVFTERTGCILKEIVAAVYAIRVRVHCFYGERKEEGYKVESQKNCVLTKDERAILDNADWIVLRTLFLSLFPCLNQTIDKKKLELIFKEFDLIDVKQLELIFKEFDLIDVIFNASENSLNLKLPVYYAAEILAKNQATLDEHIKYYKKLSQLELENTTLRISYLQALQQHPDILKQLLRISDTRKRTILHLAAQMGDIESLQFLLDLGADKEMCDSEGRTPLHLATIQGYLEAVKLLLSYGANLLALTNEKENIIHYASFYGKADLLKIFLQQKESPLLINEADNDGKTPLHKAVWGNPKTDVVKLLLDYGANPQAKNNYNYTALHWAAKNGHVESAKLLLEKNAERGSINVNGHTPLELAIQWGQDNAARLLIDPNKDIFINEATIQSADLENHYYSCFENAYEKGNTLDQILYLEKLGEFFLNKKEYIQAAKIFNSALAAAQLYKIDSEYQRLLLKKLERLEGYFLEELSIKTSADHVNYLQKYRNFLKIARKQVEAQLTYKPIDQIQADLTYCFQNLLSKLVESSIQLLKEKPPTSYAIISFGSMCCHEMYLYSNVKFAILIKNNIPEYSTYFRNLSRFLELRIINLGETKYDVMRPQKIKEGILKDQSFTPHGFSMDIGGITPLGKKGVYELIGTPKQLASFQELEFLQKHGGEVPLVNTLAQCSFIIGDESLSKQYIKQVEKILNSRKNPIEQKLRQQRALQLLKGYLEEFKLWLSEERVDLRKINLKKELYHPLQMIIGALALYYGLDSKNTLNTINKLQEQGIFNSEGAHNLQKILKQIMTWRFRSQCFYLSETEVIFSAKNTEGQSNAHLFTFNDQDSKELLEIYRVLIPFCKIAQAFIEGHVKSFSKEKFYNENLNES